MRIKGVLRILGPKNDPAQNELISSNLGYLASVTSNLEALDLNSYDLLNLFIFSGVTLVATDIGKTKQINK